MIWHRWIVPEAWPEKSFKLPSLQSHRGFHASGLRENSLAAFQESRRLGFQMVECDVRLSADRVPVIVHDSDLMRLWNANTPVHRLESQVLRDQYSIPTLSDLLLDPKSPSFVNIEMKTKSASDPLVRKSAEVVQSCGATDRVLFSSFNPFALWLLQDYLPEAPRALLVSDESTSENAWWLRQMLAAPLLKIHMLNLKETMLTEKVLQQWAQKSMPIAAWTITDPKWGTELLDKGVQSLITDLPCKEF